MLIGRDAVQSIVGWTLKDFSYRPSDFVCLNMMNYQNISDSEDVDNKYWKIAKCYFVRPKTFVINMPYSTKKKLIGVDYMINDSIVSDKARTEREVRLIFEDKSIIIIKAQLVHVLYF